MFTYLTKNCSENQIFGGLSWAEGCADGRLCLRPLSLIGRSPTGALCLNLIYLLFWIYFEFYFEFTLSLIGRPPKGSLRLNIIFWIIFYLKFSLNIWNLFKHNWSFIVHSFSPSPMMFCEDDLCMTMFCEDVFSMTMFFCMTMFFVWRCFVKMLSVWQCFVKMFGRFLGKQWKDLFNPHRRSQGTLLHRLFHRNVLLRKDKLDKFGYFLWQFNMFVAFSNV